MVYPAAPVESGSAKIHFLTSDGNAAHGWFSVDSGTTGTGSNVVGFAAIATHVEGDPVGDPGGLPTTSVPLVLVGGDDGTNAVPMQLDGSGRLKVDISAATATVTVTGDAAGSLTVDNAGLTELAAAINSSRMDVNIAAAAATVTVTGDSGGSLTVDNAALSVTGGGTEAGALRVTMANNSTGVMTIDGTVTANLSATDNAVLDTIDAVLDAIKLDTQGIETAVEGTLTVAAHAVTNAGTFVVQEDGAALTALQLIDNIVQAEDAIHGSGDAGVMMLVVRQDSQADFGGDGDYVPLSVDANGLLRVTTAAGSGTSMTDDAAFTPGSTPGTPIFAEFDDVTPDSVDEGDAGIVRMSANRNLYGTIRDAAGNERGVNVNASNELTVAAHAVTNAGVFPVQIVDTSFAVGDGNALGEGVLMQGDDGTDRKNVNVDATSGNLQVNIDSVIPGVGSSQLGKAEDSIHGNADTGVMALVVRNDALAALGGDDGDYAPLQVNDDGALYTAPHATNTGGCKLFTSVDLDESEEDPTSGPTTIYSIYVWNTTNAPLWLQMFDTNSVTVGTTAPTNNYMIPANADSDGAGIVLPLPACGLAYGTALTVAITTASGTTSGAPAAGAAGIAIAYMD